MHLPFFGNEENKQKFFLRTSNIQPYCAYHYQAVLELSEPFEGKKPPMSLVLQDAGTYEQNETLRRTTATSDHFGNKFNHLNYTELLTSSKKR